MNKLLNIGCGRNYHTAWTNVDLVATGPGVREVDICQGLPFADATFDAVYHSHVLEHLTSEIGLEFLRECYRVLRPGGILRVVVPDLEGIARHYLDTLGQASDQPEDDLASAKHQWMTLELFDQMVRHHSGGEMGALMANPSAIEAEFIESRLGKEVSGNGQAGRKTLFRRLKRFGCRVRSQLAAFAVLLIDGRKGRRAYLEGKFRHSGEIHRWMYDRVSLGRMLQSVGFLTAVVSPPSESQIPNFREYNLDELDGRLRKPDSLFMESVKPDRQTLGIQQSEIELSSTAA